VSDSQYLSRGIDYLGALGAELRDLQGYRTLAYELIQNADDAEGANCIVFNVYQDALVVENDGVFSDCGEIEQDKCPWEFDKSHGYRCDFHRFRYVASGDKRNQADTTGAFGIGFVAVYQITDCPELISNGRHWIIHEDQPEDRRIEVCPGCEKCSQDDLPGTRFTLPWARDPNSKLRRALKVDPIGDEAPRRLLDELRNATPVAMLFLRRLRTVELRKNGQTVCKVERFVDKNSLILTSGDPKNDQTWYIISGSFEKESERLRREHPERIEYKRSSQVQVAIPTNRRDQIEGLFCAGLPTEHSVELPFHINADFYTTNDRKRIIFSQDYQSKWNREALKAAAKAVGDSLETLPALIGGMRLWKIITILKRVSEGAQLTQEGSVLAEFWNQIVPKLSTKPLILTASNIFKSASNLFLLQNKEEVKCIPVLQSLGFEIVHEDLRPYQNMLCSKDVGVSILNLKHIIDALKKCGLTKHSHYNALPGILSKRSELEALWTEVQILLKKREGASDFGELKKQLCTIALAPGKDNALWPFCEIYRADETTVNLFGSLDLKIQYLKRDKAFEQLKNLCPNFDVQVAIEYLKKLDPAKLWYLWQEKRFSPDKLLEWFKDYRKVIITDPSIKTALADLRIYPSVTDLHPISDLFLPGNFKDTIGLANIVDLSVLGKQREFLLELGLQELDFSTYVIKYLSKELAKPNLDNDKRRQAITLLAKHLGEIKDDKVAQNALSGVPLIECTDGSFHVATKCHFDNDINREILGSNAYLAILLTPKNAAVRDLYIWFGVAEEPRLASVVHRIRHVTAEPYSEQAAEVIVHLFEHLGKRVKEGKEYNELNPLKSLRWLPAKGKNDRWYKPNELYTVFRSYLFETQALFLDIPRNIQNQSVFFLEFLGIESEPSVQLVVKHLLYCSEIGNPVNTEVYRFLNRHSDEIAIRQLSGKQCLWLDGVYYAADQVFWNEHPFGRYRQRLAPELVEFGTLLKQLGVKDAPTYRDAVMVLREISKESRNNPLDDEEYQVMMGCWQLIERDLDQDSAAEQDIRSLKDTKCIPNKDRILYQPEWLFFENRAGWAAKFGDFLAGNVISRPLRGGKAMEAAGVRMLGSAVQIQLVDCPDQAEAPEMKRRLVSRLNEIGRVLSGNISSNDVQDSLKMLGQILCYRASLIRIKYQLNVFGQTLHSQVEETQAFFDPEGVKLYFAAQDGRVMWSAVARELAIALYPEEDPGRYAAMLKEVLAPKSLEDVQKSLDELGFAPLDASLTVSSVGPEPVATLGRDEPVRDDKPITARPEEPLEKPPPNTTEQAIEAILGGDAPPPTRPPADRSATPKGAGKVTAGEFGGRTRGEGATRTPPAWRGTRTYVGGDHRNFVSYVAVRHDNESSDPEGIRQSARIELEEKAIEAILSLEPHWKRAPTHNPGFDLFEKGSDGQSVCWCEVKAMSGTLDDRPVTLTRTEFELAQKHGDKYWLYIVEQADTDRPQIVRIQDPAGKARYFTFDRGWRAVADKDTETKE